MRESSHFARRWPMTLASRCSGALLTSIARASFSSSSNSFLFWAPTEIDLGLGD